MAADLTDHPTVKGNAKALGTVTGIINGSGSVIAAIGLLFIGPLQQAYGWDSVWVFLIVCVICGTLLMSPKVYKEMYCHESHATSTSICSTGDSTEKQSKASSAEMVNTGKAAGAGSYQTTLSSNEC